MTKVKLCGLTRPGDIEAANQCHPDYVGFVFAQGSRRAVSPAQAKLLREELDPSIKTVGVFVNQSAEWVSQLCQDGIIDLVQLHGEEDEAYLDALRRMRPGVQIIRSVAVGTCVPPVAKGADYLLFDTASAARGGVGKTFDWALLKDGGFPPFFLAGGLGLHNVRQAIQHTRPYAVDVSSGIETDGVKDHKKMQEFVNLARQTHTEI